jgi:hypothetical protein
VGMFWDPAFLILLVVFFALSALSFLHPSGRRVMKKQTDYQQDVNEKVLVQNKAMEDLITKQYAETNERSDKALAQAAESLRLHSEALEQLKGMNSAIARLDSSGGAGARRAGGLSGHPKCDRHHLRPMILLEAQLPRHTPALDKCWHSSQNVFRMLSLRLHRRRHVPTFQVARRKDLP